MTPRPFSLDPISISFTGWKRYNKCAHQHWLVMTGQRPKLVNERNFLNGQVLHKVLERWFGNDAPPSWIAEQAEPVWHEYVEKKYILFKGDGDREELRQKCIRWGAALAQQIEQLGIDKTRCLTEQSVERELVVDGYRVLLKGFIDVLAPTADNQWLIFDLKCSASRSVMDAYQMVFYSLLLLDDLADGDVRRNSAFILPALDDIVPFDVQDEHRAWLLGDLERMARDIIAGKFDPDPDSGACFFCDVKALCPIMGSPSGTGRINL